MEQRCGADQVWPGLERYTAGGLNVFELVDGGKVAIHQDGIGQGPEVLGRLEFWGIGWEKEKKDVVGDPQLLRLVPACSVQDEHDFLGGRGADTLREGGQFGLTERDADRGRHRPAGRRMDKADQIPPLIPMLDRRERALSVETPDLVQDRFQADAVLVDGPELDRGVGKRRGDLPQQRPQVFLQLVCSAASAFTCRGRGLRRLPSRRTRYAQPRYTLMGRPSRSLIHAATVRPNQYSPSGAGPRTASASSASKAGDKSGAARCECV